MSSAGRHGTWRWERRLIGGPTRSKQFVKVVKEAQIGWIERGAVTAGEVFDPLRAEMFFNVARDGFEIEGAVAAAGVAAIDEAEIAVAVDQQIVECGVAVDEDDVFRDPRSVGRELS